MYNANDGRRRKRKEEREVEEKDLVIQGRVSFGPSWFWDDLVLGRVGFGPTWFGPSWFWAELTQEPFKSHSLFVFYEPFMKVKYYFAGCFKEMMFKSELSSISCSFRTNEDVKSM